MRVLRRKMTRALAAKAAAQARPRARWVHRAVCPKAPPAANCMGPEEGGPRPDPRTAGRFPVEPPAGLIEQQHAGVLHQRQGEVQLLPVPASRWARPAPAPPRSLPSATRRPGGLAGPRRQERATHP